MQSYNICGPTVLLPPYMFFRASRVTQCRVTQKSCKQAFLFMQYLFHKPGQNEPGHQARQMKVAFVGEFSA